MLYLQAELSFPYEYKFLKDSGIFLDNTRICDFGCGSGEYLSKISNAFPNCKYIGFDYCKELVEVGRNKYNNLKIQVGSIDSINNDIDTIILRLILNQQSNTMSFLKKLNMKIDSGSSIIIIDSCDKFFEIDPKLALVDKKLLELRNVLSPNIEKRKLDEYIVNDMNSIGCILNSKLSYYIPINNYNRSTYNQYLIKTLNIINLNKTEQIQISDWLNTNPFIQIGISMYIFTKV